MEGEIYIKVGPKGATEDGDVWDDGCGGQVKQICIWHGDLIYSIQTTYERQGTNLLSRRHGGTEGKFEVVCFDEPITWVSGHYGSWCLKPDIFEDEETAPYNYCKVIRSLKFGTGRATYGPFGREVGEPFVYTTSTGISGFHGRCYGSDGGLLNAVGVYVRSMATGLIDQSPVPAVKMPALDDTTVSMPALENTAESGGIARIN